MSVSETYNRVVIVTKGFGEIRRVRPGVAAGRNRVKKGVRQGTIASHRGPISKKCASRILEISQG